MICLVSSFFYLTFVSFISGSVTAKFLQSKSCITEKLFLGIAVSNSIFSLISLFLPINSTVSFIYLGICLIYFFFNFKNLTSFNIIDLKPKNLFFLSYIVIILFGFFNSLYPPTIFDSGLYHIQAIEWIENYPVIPGLANLHDRFGFNPNIFVLFAATSFDDLLNQDVYSINFTVFLFFSIWLLNRLSVCINSGNYSLSFILCIILLLLISNFSFLSSPTPDFICIIFPLFILLRFVEISREDKNYSLNIYLPIILLSFYIVTVKLSTLPILLIVPILFYQNRKSISFKELIPVLLLALLIIIPWELRNIIISGWLIFPFPGIDLFAFDWKVPVNDAIYLKNAITGWGRSPGGNFMDAAKLGLNAWFPIWWSSQIIFKKMLFIVLCLSPLIASLLVYFKKINKNNRYIFTVYIVSFSGFIFWFFTAPDWRFSLSFTSMCLLSLFLFIDYSVKKYSKYFLSVVSIILITFTIYSNNKSWDYFLQNYEKVSNITPKIQKLSRKKEKVQFGKFNVDGKITIEYPINDYRCFDEEIPCASYKKENLHLRGDNIKSGFYIK